MSEYYKEQHPLLCEEVSEEEPYSPRYHRRLRPTTYRGQARHNLKGAASILKRWPDHWSSFLAYWWIGLGMISLLTFVVYNSVFAFSILPTANPKPVSLTGTNEKSPVDTSLPNVYMHVFVRQNEEIDFNQYMPYIEVLSTKYNNIKYNLIVVVNDTNLDWLSAEENNEIALNSLWKKGFKEEITTKYNINVEYVTLSGYMENSPLRKHWKTLPHQLIEFLARAVSIWDKGGVAFNPFILTPRSQNTIYQEKLHKLLSKYGNSKKSENDTKILNKFNKTIKKDRKLNNIRDIINALENDDNSLGDFSQNLSEAENIQSPVTRNERHLMTATETGIKYEMEKKTEPLNHIKNHSHMNSYSNDTNTKEPKHRIMTNSTTESGRTLDIRQNTTKLSLLPLFLDYLFHNKLEYHVKRNHTQTKPLNRTRKSVTDISKSEDMKRSSLSIHSLDTVDNDTYKPVIISAAGIYNQSGNANTIKDTPSKEPNENLERNRLTIDLKGDIIATDTACHAFLGTIFSNAVHHSEEESVTDFIIAELSIFCKGLLSSCMGIDLILL